MTPDLSYTTGREGERSARIINGMKKTKKNEPRPRFSHVTIEFEVGWFESHKLLESFFQMERSTARERELEKFATQPA